MDATVEKMETQLKRWRARIDHLTAKTEVAGTQASFDTLMHVGELKALHAIARAKLDALTTASDTTRECLKAEAKLACEELVQAFKRPRPAQ